MADGVWEGVYPQIFGRSRQLLQNKFYDPRKGCDGEVVEEVEVEKNCESKGPLSSCQSIA